MKLSESFNFLIFLAITFCFSCQCQSQIQILDNCSLKCENAVPDSIKFISIVHGVEFHYYEYPQKYTLKSLKFYWDEYSGKWEDYEDSVRWTSPDSSFVMLKYIEGFNYDYPLDSFGDIDYDKIDSVRIHEIIDERFEKAGKCAFLQYPDAKTEYICRSKNMLTICAKSPEKRLFYKIIVVHVEGGMNDFVILSIEYPLKQSDEFDAIAIECMNYFSNE
ncbi:hypothetical protein SDC9_57258 [bioreactor metagenome]|uniref:Uncharacterized protein n=1 Tax=bioreactor metagenome TaxID=1076179 RepID=A0A644X4Z6_9ZZZZ